MEQQNFLGGGGGGVVGLKTSEESKVLQYQLEWKKIQALV